jgi:hypothetical protein
MQDENHAGSSAGGHGVRPLPCTLSAIAILLSLCAFFVVSSFVLTHLYPTPQPAIGATSVQTIVVQTAAAEIAQTVIANFQSRPTAPSTTCTATVTLIPVSTSIPENVLTLPATSTLIPYATTTQFIYVRPTLEDIPGRPASGDACCRHCTNSQPCGNGCISWNFTCHQPPGCACP